MKRFAGWLMVGVIVFNAAPSWAEGRYVSGNIGFGIQSDAKAAGIAGTFDNDPAFVINGAIGTHLRENIRVEGEIGLHTNTADRTSNNQEFNFSVVSFMANGYFEIPTQSPLTPYVGAGLGFGIAGASEDTFNSSDSDLVGAVQLMAGLGYQINPKVTLTFGYRYFTTSDPDFLLATPGVFFETEFTSHDFLFGARILF